MEIYSYNSIDEIPDLPEDHVVPNSYLEPGPWFTEPWWRKTYLWMRYVAGSKPRNIYGICRYLWTWYVTDKRPKDSVPRKYYSPSLMVGLTWGHENTSKTGRYYRVVWEED